MPGLITYLPRVLKVLDSGNILTLRELEQETNVCKTSLTIILNALMDPDANLVERVDLPRPLKKDMFSKPPRFGYRKVCRQTNQL